MASDTVNHTQGERTRRSRGDTNISGVDILPIPPALDFPYPTESKETETAHTTSASRPQAERQNSFPFFPPRKNSSPVAQRTKSKGQSNPSATTPGTPGLLERIGSAPIRPQGPRKYGTEKPSLFRPSSNTRHNSVYEPETWGSDYSESSDEDNNAPVRTGNRSHIDPNMLQRSSTSPLQRRPSDQYRRFAFGDEGYKTRGHVSKHDGRLNISMRETAHKGYLAKALGSSLRNHLAPSHHLHEDCEDLDGTSSPNLGQTQTQQTQQRPGLGHKRTASTVSNLSVEDPVPIPKLNIVVMVIGSRGDIQPFLRLGKILKEQHGHRVRIATHPTFKKFVEEDAKLEFFNIGGDPAELMAFMVKNPGLIPKSETLRSGEIPRRRAQMFEMFQGFWRACISSSDSEPDPSNRKLLESKNPFVADAIIANPPSFAHIHCAERLGIPLHLMFTFPNTPTQQFPHPLTNIRQTNVDANYTNFMSYPLVEMMQWQGLGDLINEFRVKTLGLDAMSMLWAPGQLFRMKVPYSYLWSPGLIPKPADWGPEINITGFVFLDLASSFKPPDDLAKFLEAGDAPVYIGFGSIVVDDPDKFTELIFKAVKKAGVRALVNKGWGGLGGENLPDNVFMLDNTPHDWLFPRVRAVVHHGGAGTTAIGLKCGRPTMVVPFFGDQPFWGAMIAKAGAGAEPVPYKELSSDKLAEGIKELLTEEKQKNAKLMAEKIEAEGDGAENAVKSFHRHLPRQGQHSLRCSILQDRVAVWSLKGSEVHLSPLAAHLLIKQGKITFNDLRLVRIYDWNDFEGPGEPLTGMGTSVLGSLVETGAGIGKIPFHWSKIIKRKDARAKHNRDKRSEQLQKSAKDGDKAYKKQEGEDSQKLNDHDKKLSATLPAGQHEKRNVGPEQRQQDARDKGGELGAESMFPDGNEPPPPGTHASIFNMLKFRKATTPKARKIADDQTLVNESEDDEPENDVAIEMVQETGRGFKQSGGALLKLPMNLWLALARGLHNAPRLYGDDTVRTSRRITGFQSGLLAGGDEFVYGIWDSWSGLVMQPYRGVKYDGAIGFFEGVGKGIGGFILKDLAAIIGPPAYAMKGVHKEMTKHRQPTMFIRRTRMVEGELRFNELSGEQRKQASKAVADAWEIIEDVNREIKKVIKQQGLRGRVQVWRRKQWLKENGVIANVQGMQRALEAKREGRDWEVEFREEVERHAREQEKARQNRKAERKRRTQRNEKGRRIKGPDVPMKPQFRTHHALKKSAKRADKRWLKSQSALDTRVQSDQGGASKDAVAELTTSQSTSNLASAHDGVAATDHTVDTAGLSPNSAAFPNEQRKQRHPPAGRSRDNSGNTLVPEPIELDGTATKTPTSPVEMPATIGKDDQALATSGDGPQVLSHEAELPQVQGSDTNGRGVVPRMVTT